MAQASPEEHQKRMAEIKHKQNIVFYHAMLYELAAKVTEREWQKAIAFAKEMSEDFPCVRSALSYQTQADHTGDKTRA